MLNLASGSSLRIKASVAGDLRVSVSYVDVKLSDSQPFSAVDGKILGAITDTIYHEIVESPIFQWVRNVKRIVIVNAGLVANSPLIEEFDGTTSVPITTLLAPGHRVEFDETGAWKRYDVNNEVVGSGTASFGAETIKGTWNAATNLPVLVSGVGTLGDAYIVNVPGNTMLDGLSDWAFGDRVSYDGSAWRRAISTQVIKPKQRIVKNSYPANNEQAPTANAGGGTATNNVVLPLNRWGFRSGFTQTAFSQSNISNIPADTNYYIASFYVYVPPGTSGVNIAVTNMGLVGGDNASFSYNVDNPISSTGLILANPQQTSVAGASLSRNFVVEKYNDGWYRFSKAFKNNGQTVFVFRIDGHATAITTGLMLEMVPDDGSSIMASEYVPSNNGLTAPFINQGKLNQLVRLEKRFPFNKVMIFSDSLFGAGTYKPAQIVNFFGGQGLVSTLGGTKTVLDGFGTAPQTSVITRLNQYLSQLGNAFVVICGGRNDDLTTPALRQAIVTAVKSAVNSLGHNNYCFAAPWLRFPTTNGGNTFTASISGTTLTLTAGSGVIAGRLITGVGVAPGTFTLGSTNTVGGTVQVTISQTVAAVTMAQSTGTEEINFIPNPSLSPGYANIEAYIDLLKTTFPGRVYDPNIALVNSYNPLLAGDIIAKLYDYRPPSITGTAATDNLHPIDAENYIVVEDLVAFIRSMYLI